MPFSRNCPDQLRAPAKINWFLSVLGRRDDGYHDIRSLMQTVDLYDTLTFEAAGSLEVISDIPGLAEGDNLVMHAARAVRKAADPGRGARIRVTKEIPVAAGLGGGSSDAAATIIGLNRFWGLGLDPEALHKIAASIGSDVPFFIDAGLAVAEGRGERITVLQDAPEVSLLLVNPGIAVSTAWAYRSWQIGLTKKTIDIKLFCQTLARKDFNSLPVMLVNDLEDAVIAAHPEIGRIKGDLVRYGAAAAAMSGSGSTVFGVFSSPEEANRAADRMGQYWNRVVKTVGRPG